MMGNRSGMLGRPMLVVAVEHCTTVVQERQVVLAGEGPGAPAADHRLGKFPARMDQVIAEQFLQPC